MSIPAWILAIFGALMLLAAEVSAGQLVAARAWTRSGGTGADIAVAHLLMGIAMAGIVLADLDILPNAVWEVVFAVMTTWFAWCLKRECRGRGAAAVAHGRYAPYLARSVAMLYVFAALAARPQRAQACPCPARAGCPGWRAGRPAACRPSMRRRWH